MRAFIGPYHKLGSFIRKVIPPPTYYWTYEQVASGQAEFPYIYGHRGQGIYLSPLSHLLTPDGDAWGITFQFMGCDGLREWQLTVPANEVHSTLVTVLWLCRTSGDAWACMSLLCLGENPPALDDYIGFVGLSPTKELNHSYFPFPMWPNLEPRKHALTQ